MDDFFNKVCFKLDEKVVELEKQQEKALKIVIEQGGYFQFPPDVREPIILEVLTMVRDIFLEVYNE